MLDLDRYLDTKVVVFWAIVLVRLLVCKSRPFSTVLEPIGCSPYFDENYLQEISHTTNFKVLIKCNGRD